MRKNVTTNLDDSDETFIRKHFSEEIEKGKLAATWIRMHMLGRAVRRTYYFERDAISTKLPLDFVLQSVLSEGAGVVVLVAEDGSRREFPSVEFSFKFRSDYKAVACVAKTVMVLIEVL